MTAGRMARENLPQEERHGGYRREHAVTPPGITNLAPHGEEGFGWQPRGPFACTSLTDGSDPRDPGVLLHDGVLRPIHTGDA
jgi:hypothetical protein